MKVGVVIQQPDEHLDYDFNYTDWFGDTNDAIDTIEVASAPAGLTLTGIKTSATAVKIWAGGGTDGDIYYVEVTITTTAGRVKQDELEIRIKEYT